MRPAPGVRFRIGPGPDASCYSAAPDVRKAAQAVFPGLYDNCGYDLVKKKLEGEDKAALALALPLLEKAREVRRGDRRRSGRAPVLKLKTAVRQS